MSTLERRTGVKAHAAEDPQPGPAEPLSERVRSLRMSPEVVAGRSRSGWLAWALCLVFAGTTAWLAYKVSTLQPLTESAQTGKDAASRTADAPPAAADPVQGEVALEAKGYIIPAHQILVSPKVSGMIVELNIQEGMRVQKDKTVLARLEDVDYRHKVERAKAMLEAAHQRQLETLQNRDEDIAQAGAELKEAKAQLAQLQDQRRRDEELVRKRVVSQQDFELSDSRYIAMKHRAERLQFALSLMEKGPREEKRAAAAAEVKQAQEELQIAEWNLSNCTIYPPIDGTILKKNAEKGNIVNPIVFNGSYSICDMADLSDLEVDLTIQERDISRVFRGQPCKVRAEAFPERTYQGTVSRLMPIADRAKGAIPVRVKVSVPADEEGVYLKPEMGVLVTFLKGKPAAGKKAKSPLPPGEG